MDLGRLGILRLAEQRLGWLDRRQEVIAQNIANADTPGYVPRDLMPFETRLQRLAAARPAETQAGHLPGARRGQAVARVDRARHETTLDGNRVALDEQLVKVSDTEIHQGLTSSLYRKYLGLFRIALGRSG